MSLSQSEQQQAYGRAEQRYATAHPERTTNVGVSDDLEFRAMYQEEVAAIEASHTSPPPPPDTTASRCDSAVQTCPLARRDAERSVNCNFTSLNVNKSGDANRVYRSNRGDRNILEIVAGRTSAKATIELRNLGVSTSCPTHQNRVWNVSPRVSDANLSNNANLDLSLGWTGDTSHLGFFNQNISPTTYSVIATTHNKTESITIRVYPDYAWEGSASVSFRVEETTRNIRYDGLSIQLTRTDDNVSTQYGGRIQEIVDLLARYFLFIFQVKDIAERVTAGALTWSLVPPTFQITIGSRWQENSTDLRCGYYYNLRLAFNPLIGIQFTANLGIVAIQAIPYIGSLVAHMAGDEITRYIAVTFTLQGTIGCDVTASKSSSQERGTVNGGLTGQIGFDFQVRGQVNRDMVYMAINCGVRAGARATVTGTLRGPLIDRSGSYASLGANFDGLVIYASAYCRTGSSQTTRQETVGRDYAGGYTGPDSTYEVRDVAHRQAGETNREQAGGAGESAYTWIDARSLGETRINL